MSLLPDFEGLAMFAKVAEERSFAGAARTFEVSVATVSQAVARYNIRPNSRTILAWVIPTARSDVWRFTNAAGEEVVIKPEGPLRVTNADALCPPCWRDWPSLSFRSLLRQIMCEPDSLSPYWRIGIWRGYGRQRWKRCRISSSSTSVRRIGSCRLTREWFRGNFSEE